MTVLLAALLAQGCSSTECSETDAGACQPAGDGPIPAACPDGAASGADLSGAISLELERRTQKTGSDCGPTSLWMVAGFWGGAESHADVMKHFKILPGIGVYDSHIAMAAMDLGYRATIISYNYRVLHPLWHGLSGDQLLAKLQSYLPKIKNQKDKVSATGYIDYLERKGELKLAPLSRELILSYLQKGVPVIASLDVEYLYRGKTTVDPFIPEHWTHAVVIHGYDPAADAFHIADPWPQIPLPHKGGHYTLPSARLITAILLAFQINDGFMVVVEKG